MGLEAAGQILGPRKGEEETYGDRKRPNQRTYVYRVLQLLAVHWGKHIAGLVPLATAIADNYNSVKHYDRGDLPAQLETYLIGFVNRYIVRLLALMLTGKGEELLGPFREKGALWEVEREFEGNGLRISEEGRFEPINVDAGSPSA
jgi:hypothetical protein